jgi:hypothetical protein
MRFKRLASFSALVFFRFATVLLVLVLVLVFFHALVLALRSSATTAAEVGSAGAVPALAARNNAGRKYQPGPLLLSLLFGTGVGGGGGSGRFQLTYTLAALTSPNSCNDFWESNKVRGGVM